MVSSVKQEQFKREVTYHSGQIPHNFQSNQQKKEHKYDADETHYEIKMDNHKTLPIID